MNNDYKQKFYDVFLDDVLPYTSQIEIKRIIRVKTFYTLCFLSLLIFLVFAYCLVFMDVSFKIQIALLVLYLLSLYICVRYLSYAGIKFKKSIRDKFFRILPLSFGKIRWNNQLLAKVLSLTKCDLFETHNIVKCDDAFDGIYRDVDFVIAEIELRRADSEISSNISFSVFKGLMISFECNKNFEGQTLISSVKKQRFWDKPTLQESFEVSASDEDEAKEIVTDEFLQSLQNLQTVHGSKDIKCLFSENNIIFSISTKKNLFEKGYLFSSLNNPKNIKKFCDEILAIFELIEYFKSNERIGL